MCRFEGVHGVVIHGVEFLLTDPVEDADWQQLEQDVDKAGVVLHVHWQAIVRHLTDDPGTATSAHIHLQKKIKKQHDFVIFQQPILHPCTDLYFSSRT